MTTPHLSLENCLIQPYYPYEYIGDRFYNPWHELVPGLYKSYPHATDNTYPWTTTTTAEKNHWQKQKDGSQKFSLEVVGYGKEHISAEIKNDGLPYLEVKLSKDKKNSTFTFSIPDDQNLSLDLATSKVEHGLLEIFIPAAQKQESKTIKIL